MSFEVFNILEGVFWIVLAFCSYTFLPRFRRELKHLSLFLSFVLIIFGISDFIEVYTPPFWEVWWLLFLKGLSLLGFLVVLIWYVMVRAKR